MKNQPFRVFEGPHQPYEPFWTLRNAAETDSGEPEIELYGFISEFSWWGDEVTPEKFKKDLYELGANGPVTVRVNSGGGEVFAASVMKSILVTYPGMITMRIDGLAASAATIVILGGDKIKIQDSAYMMIHDPSALAWGNIEEFKTVLEMLKTVKDGIIDGYSARTNLSAEKLAKMMTDETWMTAKEAQLLGFADEVITSNPSKTDIGTAMKNAAIFNALSSYRNVPAELLAQAQAPLDQSTSLAEPGPSLVEPETKIIAPEAARLRDEIQLKLRRRQ